MLLPSVYGWLLQKTKIARAPTQRRKKTRHRAARPTRRKEHLRRRSKTVRRSKTRRVGRTAGQTGDASARTNERRLGRWAASDPGRTRTPWSVWQAAGIALLANSADGYLLFLLIWIAGPAGWSGVETALVVLALRLPALAGGVLVGRAVDRWGGRRLMVVDLATRSLLSVALLSIVVARGGMLPLPVVMVLGAVSGVSAPATYAAIRSMVPQLVPDDSLVRANSVIGLADQLPLVLGTVLVGPILALGGVGAALVLPCALLVTALALAFGLPKIAQSSASGDTVDRPGGHGTLLAQMSAIEKRRRSSWTPRVIAIIGLSTAYYFVYGPFETASPSYVRDQLHGNAQTYSLIWALFGVGAVLGVALARLLHNARPGLVNALGAVAWGVIMMPLALLHDPFSVSILFLVAGIIWGPYTTVETTALQRWVPAERRGSVFGVQRSLLASAAPLGAAVGAVAVSTFPAPMVLLASAISCAAAGGLALLVRDLRASQGPTAETSTRTVRGKR